MIGARHTVGGRLLAASVAGFGLSHAFREVRIHGDAERTGAALLLVANHFSWWDGFIQYRLCRELLGRQLYVMMLEEELQRHPVLKRCGCFSVRKHSRDAVESLDYALRLLGDGRNAVLLFPQGRIESMHTERIRFESGLGYLLKHARSDFRIGFNANFADYFSFRRPSLDIWFESRPRDAFRTVAEAEAAYNTFYRACARAQHGQR